MKSRVTRIVECIVASMAVLLSGSALPNAFAQDSSNVPYLNPQLSPEQRATDLVRRMTLAEKASQMQNNSATVPRLKVPAYQWWSEALHGVINEGVTARALYQVAGRRGDGGARSRWRRTPSAVGWRQSSSRGMALHAHRNRRPSSARWSNLAQSAG